MDFFRNLAGQPAVNRASEVATEVAAAAAAQWNDFMENAHQQQRQHQQHHHQQPPGNGGPPPASAAALRQLPTISVSAEDLVEPSNRECCICFEE